VVIAVGDQSTAKIGDRVAWQGVPGSYAEMVAVPDDPRYSDRVMSYPLVPAFRDDDGTMLPRPVSSLTAGRRTWPL